jgi:protein TonB
MDLSITGSQFGMSMLLMTALVIGAILLVRNMIGSKSEKLSAKYKGTASANMKKYPEANVFDLSGTFWRLGLVCSISLAVLAFSWTTYEEKVNTDGYTLDLPDDIEVASPRTAEPPPPPPPPPPPVIEAVPDDEVVDEAPKFKDQTVTKDVANTPAPQTPKPKPVIKERPKPAPAKEVVDEIFQVVEQMPRFPGCENTGTDEEKTQCSNKKLLEYIYKNIKYPTIARENGVEGTAVVSFVVEKDGSITDAKIIRDPGAGCGGEALRVVEKMNDLGTKWTPGKQRNENVRVQFNLPVRFRLE